MGTRFEGWSSEQGLLRQRNLNGWLSARDLHPAKPTSVCNGYCSRIKPL